MAQSRRPYSRSEYNRALILNALNQPFNVLLLAAVLIAGLLLDAFLPLLVVGVAVYGIAAARTYFDEDEANKVLEREKAERRKTLEAGRLDTRSLSDPIARLLTAARQREARIRDAIEGRTSLRGGVVGGGPLHSGRWRTAHAGRSSCTRRWPRRRRHGSSSAWGRCEAIRPRPS